MAPGFESVRDLFEQQMLTLAEENAQLCIYVGGERVVDLWGSASGDDKFTADSLVNVFSSGKSLESIALATLVSQGLLNYESKIAEYWPAFAAAGKDQVTVADLMRHEAGLAAFSVSLDPGDLHREVLRQNRISAIIEQHPQRYPAGDRRREYHAITRGWIANELFRRVDPSGRTMGEFLRESFAAPHGMDVHIGIEENDLTRRSPVTPVSPGRYLRESFKPRIMGRRVPENFFSLAGKMLRLMSSMRGSTSLKAPPPFQGMETIGAFNEAVIAMGETPSANAHCSARGLARLAAVMAGKGSATGISLLDEAAWQAAHGAPVARSMGVPTTFTQGGVAEFSEAGAASSTIGRALNEGREGFYGWMGLGGSIFQWNPALNIGFAFVPTSLHVLDLLNVRGKHYQTEVMRCVQRSA